MNTKIIPLSRINYHVFQWVCHSGKVDVNALIEEAFNTVKNCEIYDLTDGSVRMSVRPRLAELVEERLDEWRDTWVSDVSDGRFVSAEDAELLTDPDAPPQAPLDSVDLCVPLACVAWDEVSPFALAEALLHWKGKMHKLDPDRPEAI